MYIKLNFLFILLFFSKFTFGQSNRIPNWSKSVYEWQKTSLKWNHLYLTAEQNKIRLELSDSSYVLKVKTKNSHQIVGIPNADLSYSNDGAVLNGNFKINGNNTILVLSDSINLIIGKGRNIIYSNGTKRNIVLKYKSKDRIGLSYQYGPETRFLLFPPVKFTFDLFPLKGIDLFFGCDASINVLGVIWGHLGSHIGYQFKSLILQTDIDYTFLETAGVFTFNPKAGFILRGLFIKLGPSFELSTSTVSESIEEFNYWEIAGTPMNIEVGYYLKLNN